MERKARYEAAPGRVRAKKAMGETEWPVSAPEETPSTPHLASPQMPPGGHLGGGESRVFWGAARAAALEMAANMEWAMEIRRAILMIVKSNSTQGFRDGCMMLARAIEKRYNVN